MYIIVLSGRENSPCPIVLINLSFGCRTSGSLFMSFSCFFLFFTVSSAEQAEERFVTYRCALWNETCDLK